MGREWFGSPLSVHEGAGVDISYMVPRMFCWRACDNDFVARTRATLTRPLT